MSRLVLGRAATTTAAAIGLVLLGAAAGLVGGLATPTHTQLAGTDATVRIRVGQGYDQLEFTGLLTGRRAADHAVLGEPVAVSIRLDLDTRSFLKLDGSFDPRVLPAYIQAYSDPEQLAQDVQQALVSHLLHWAAGGALIAVLGLLGRRGYVSWRRRRDAHSPDAPAMRAAAIAYRAPERMLARRAALVAALAALVAAVPSSGYSAAAPATITPNSFLDGTPLAGAEVSGPLLPAFDAAEAYVRRYFADTNTYYAQVLDALQLRLADGELTLPGGSDVVHFGFVTDRHCNTGMDRVIIALLEHFDVHLLVSGGDDAFSGSFGFESACTAGLASASREAHITDVFVGGNHDSPLTLDAERDQGIQVLDDRAVSAGGLTFVGVADPRTSRYGQGIEPASATAREDLVTAAGEQAGGLACHADGPAIVVMHDPHAGLVALQNGCGRAVLALDGHSHRQSGPTALPLPDGSTGYAFVGASTGGAPTDSTIQGDFAANLTVGPLNHPATINIVSVDATTGRLIGVTQCQVSTDQDVTFNQELTGLS